MNILLLETSGLYCSVAICDENQILSSVITDKPNAHSELLAPLIRQVLDHSTVHIKDINAIAISHGPGSYTSLRVGVSTAKAMCLALSIPLISIPTDEILMNGIADLDIRTEDIIVSMIDARRMEVYYSVWDSFRQLTNPLKAINFEIESLKLESQGNIHICGSGAQKYKQMHSEKKLLLHHEHPISEHMEKAAREYFKQKNFVNIGEYSPYYFKEPNITKSNKKII
ncbi:MAG: tRNA (adenosine(37)-N6)-threonylcarbamoyltransferase complex dimerization subunit type 1 TsaB [Saprospiraceae bacterium]|nr:tRNA (adenosine(37)-N6)-threonylcarbamoyltransferase complex dimerization subunit type 1 TsaB [Saprospiraceae bacterium]